MRLFFINLLCALMSLISCVEYPVTRIEVDLDNKYLNPIQHPGITSTIRVYAYTDDGKKVQLSLNDVVLSANTVNASGNVDVVSLSDSVIKPLAGGISEVTAVYVKDGRTFVDKEKNRWEIKKNLSTGVCGKGGGSSTAFHRTGCDRNFPQAGCKTFWGNGGKLRG